MGVTVSSTKRIAGKGGEPDFGKRSYRPAILAPYILKSRQFGRSSVHSLGMMIANPSTDTLRRRPAPATPDRHPSYKNLGHHSLGAH